jgi:hypothetical protein
MSPGFGKSKFGNNKYGEKCMYALLSNMNFLQRTNRLASASYLGIIAANGYSKRIGMWCLLTP